MMLVVIAILFSKLLAPNSIADEWQPVFEQIEKETSLLYSLRDFKRKHFGFDFSARIRQEQLRLRALPKPVNAAEVRNSLRSVFLAARDIHSRPFFLDPHYSSVALPLGIRSAKGRYYLVRIDRTRLPVSAFPFELGDEVTALNYRPVKEEVMKQIRAFPGTGLNPIALAERAVTFRSELHGFDFPQENSAVLTLSKNGRLFHIPIPWIRTRKGISPSALTQPSVQKHDQTNPVSLYSTIGGRQSFTPQLGSVVWMSEPESPFFSYIFLTPSGRKWGYVRIPTYYRPGIAKNTLSQFYKLMELFAAETQGLVFDQTNNSGGSVLYAQMLFRAFIEKPIKNPIRFQWIVNETLFEFGEKWTHLKALAERAKTDPVALEKFQNLFDDQLVDKHFIDGFMAESDLMIRLHNQPLHPRVSPSIAPHGTDTIPAKAGLSYKKPILVLVNELTTSAGDMMAALFQDTGRGKLLGVRTAGAGAYFVQIPSLPNNAFGLSSFGISFANVLRAGGATEIENRGVTPDFPYSFTAEDFSEQMLPYKRAILATIRKLSEQPENLIEPTRRL